MSLVPNQFMMVRIKCVDKIYNEFYHLTEGAGDSAEARTRDPQLRRLLLYPTELRNQSAGAKIAIIIRIVGNVGINVLRWRYRLPISWDSDRFCKCHFYVL